MKDINEKYIVDLSIKFYHFYTYYCNEKFIVNLPKFRGKLLAYYPPKGLFNEVED